VTRLGIHHADESKRGVSKTKMMAGHESTEHPAGKRVKGLDTAKRESVKPVSESVMGAVIHGLACTEGQ
jgi:hypothetical protein